MSFPYRVLRSLGLATALALPGVGRAQAATSPAASGQASNLVIVVSGARHTRGLLRVAVYAEAEAKAFPNQDSRAVRQVELPLTATTDTVRFTGLPAGTYAIAVHHDENGNHKQDTNLFGAPKEGWGVTNDPRPHLRAPRFAEAAVKVAAPVETVRIALTY